MKMKMKMKVIKRMHKSARTQPELITIYLTRNSTAYKIGNNRELWRRYRFFVGTVTNAVQSQIFRFLDF